MYFLYQEKKTVIFYTTRKIAFIFNTKRKYHLFYIPTEKIIYILDQQKKKIIYN